MFPRKSNWPVVVVAVLVISVIVAACGSETSAPSDASGSSVDTELAAPTATTAASTVTTAPTLEPVLTVSPRPSAQATSTSTPIPAETIATPPTVPVDATATGQAGADLATVVFFIPTITCPGCAKRVEANAGKAPGVVEAKVDLSTRNVTVLYEPTVTDPDQIAEAIRAGGDTVVPEGQD